MSLESGAAHTTRHFWAGFAAAGMLLLLPCCASQSYMGIAFAGDQADAELQQLAARAKADDKQAKLDLGIRFEEGRGVPIDKRRAAQLYRMAASDSGGVQMIYTPPMGNGRASTVPVDTGPRVEGLGEARERLLALEGEQGLDPAERRHTLNGAIQFVGFSDICSTESAAIEVIAGMAVGDCRATAYRLVDQRGRVFDLFDLVLFTSDTDAIVDMHIPFGMIDTSETELYSDDGGAVRGKVTFETVPASGGDLNIITSFKRGR